MSQVIAVMDVGGTSIKTGAVRFDDGDDPQIELGPVLPTNSNEPADVVLDALAREGIGTAWIIFIWIKLRETPCRWRLPWH